MNQGLYPQFSILLVDDEVPWLYTLSLSLERTAGITNVIECQDSREVMDILSNQDVGLILLDLTMPTLSGEQLLGMIAERYPAIFTIVVSGMNQVETAVRCMKLGAYDYYVKTVEQDRLITGVSRAVRMIELQRMNRDITSRFLTDSIEHPEAFEGIVGASKSMRSVFQYVECVARSNQPVLITGESGVGKELFARAIHKASGSAGPMVSVNVAGLDDGVFADTLFGHVKGAFTGADQSRKGMVEGATDGTLLLDEIGDLSLPSQVKLLRLLQEGEYFPVGADTPKRLKARIVCTTLHNLESRQSTGQFRRDLYYRLCTHHVRIPSLREHKEDIPLLLHSFLDEAAQALGKKRPTPPPQLNTLLENYGFPGNIRELRSMVYDAVSMHKAGMLSVDSFVKAMGGLPKEVSVLTHESSSTATLFTSAEQLPTFSQVLDLLVVESMRRAKGNQSVACRMLGISQPALSKRLKQSREESR